MENRIFLNRYRLSLGRNGLPVEMHRAPVTRTFRGHEIDTGREVAIAIVSPAPNDPQLLEKLETEAIASEEVNHINIPRLYDFGREDNELIYVSEYWEGRTASAWVEARGPLTVPAVLRVALQVTEAMNATVFQRLYHPSLNPDNILFIAGQTGEGDWPPIKILSWHGPPVELAQPADAAGEAAARFAAPEQLRQGKVDVRSEVYSLGATMWFLLTGLPPSTNDPDGLRTAISKLRGVPKIVRHLLERMVRLDPRERPQDPVALASYLQTCLGRVERRAKIKRRFGIPLTTPTRVSAPRAAVPNPLQSLTRAVAVMLVAMLGILFLTQSLIGRRTSEPNARANQVLRRTPKTFDAPNESATSTKSALREKDRVETPAASRTSPPAAAVAAASPTSRAELISIPPSPAPVKSGTVAQTDGRAVAQMNSTERAQVAAEPPPPSEGPSVPEDARIADDGEVAPRDESAPNEIASAPTVAQSPTAEKNEPHSAVLVPAPEQVANSSEAAEEEGESEAIPNATPRKTVVAKDASSKARTRSLHDSAQTHLAKNRTRSRHTVKRAQALPQLRVGSAPAEFVGTTRDGNWILSVDATGERVIVPPPPGYGQ